MPKKDKVGQRQNVVIPWDVKTLNVFFCGVFKDLVFLLKEQYTERIKQSQKSRLEEVFRSHLGQHSSLYSPSPKPCIPQPFNSLLGHYFSLSQSRLLGKGRLEIKGRGKGCISCNISGFWTEAGRSKEFTWKHLFLRYIEAKWDTLENLLKRCLKTSDSKFKHNPTNLRQVQYTFWL